MLRLPTDIRVFLSSTFLDLQAIRQEIAHRLPDVLGTQLITMETFGSDDAPPDITSVRRVRECDLFVGIYAHRYGSVDPASGKSITELELDEAERAFSAGPLVGILLYVIDEKAPWPPEKTEETPIARAGLRRLRERAYQHTVTKFSREQDLPFHIIRDILAKLRERFNNTSLAVRQQVVPPEERLHRPIGMEFLRSTARRYLAGRGDVIEELLRCLLDAPVLLLIGNSGVGKTSLIHAGLFPRLVTDGWRVVYTRPFGLPWHDVVIQLQSSIFEGRPTYRGSLRPILGEILATIEERRLLLVIDQFEDVLSAREPGQVEQLVTDLQGVRQLAEPTLRVLISYRADLEARLGRYWQHMSGDARGLPRIYLSGVSADEALAGAQRALKDLGAELQLTHEDEAQLRNDLLTASVAAGHPDVYPPYVQMFIDHIWRQIQAAAVPFRIKDYRTAGGMEGIVSGYLERQLAYAQDSAGHIRVVLVALVRSYGAKAQRSLPEIAVDTGLTEAQCEEALERLIDLRLVRHIDDFYEVAHDFLAQRIINELVDAEEREFKRFRELLATKAEAFPTTGAPLTAEELLMLFRYKERLLPTAAELPLLLTSWLHEGGPALYWLLAARPASLLEWLRAAETTTDLTDLQQALIALLRCRIGGSPLAEDEYFAFREYQLSVELAALIAADPFGIPTRVVTWALRSRRPEVRTAAIEVVAQRIKAGDWEWIPHLRGSASPLLQWTYERLVLRRDIAAPPSASGGSTSRALAEFAVLKLLAHSQTLTEVRGHLRALKSLRPKARSWSFAQGLALQQSGWIPRLLKRAQRIATKEAEVLLGMLDSSLSPERFQELLRVYTTWNAVEAKQTGGSLSIKANALARAILRTSSPRARESLRQTLIAISLTPSAQAIASALLNVGELEDFLLILDRVATCPYSIDYWHHTEIARGAARRMEQVATTIPPDLIELLERKDFWEYLPEQEQRKSSKDVLPLQNRANRLLYIRLSAYGLIGAAQKSDQGTLCRLASHSYRLIARAAAIRLVRIAGAEGIRTLALTGTDSIKRGDAKALAGALRDAELEQFGIAQLW